jgi:serine/threonine protein kinase
MRRGIVMAQQIGPVARWTNKNIYGRWAQLANRHQKLSKAVKYLAPVAGLLAGGGYALAAFGAICMVAIASKAVGGALAFHALRYVLSLRIGNAMLQESEKAEDGKALTSEELIQNYTRKLSFAKVKLQLVEDHLRFLQTIKKHSLIPFPGLDARIAEVDATRTEFEKERDDIFSILDKRSAAGGARKTVMINEHGRQSVQLHAATIISPGKVRKRLDENLAELDEEIELLKEYAKELKAYAAGHIQRSVLEKISELQKRSTIREREHCDIKAVINKIKSGGLSPYGYEYVRMLGMGGMAAALCFYSVHHNRFVAVKVMLLKTERSSMDRFLQEAEVTIKLKHDNIARGFEAGAWPKEFIGPILGRVLAEERLSVSERENLDNAMDRISHPFYTTQLIRGYSIAELLMQQVKQGKKGLPLKHAVAIAQQVVRAIKYYNDPEIGVVHRDLKTDNIILRAEYPHTHKEYSKIIDFGLLLLEEVKDEERLTQGGMVFGTPGYISLAQATGAKIDVHTDFYALGSLIFEMVTGEPLHDSIIPMADNDMNPRIDKYFDPKNPATSGLNILLKRMLSFTLQHMHLHPDKYESSQIVNRVTFEEIERTLGQCLAHQETVHA